MECPVCKSYGRDTQNDFDNGDACRRCGTSWDCISNFLEISRKREEFRRLKIAEDLCKTYENVQIENVILHEKIRVYEKFYSELLYHLDSLTENVKKINFERLEDLIKPNKAVM